MSRFAFCSGTYQSQSPNAAAMDCINFIPEPMETPDAKSAICLYSSPGLAIFVTLPTSPVRGQTTINGRTFAVGGRSLYEVNKDGTATLRSGAVQLAIDSSQASMAAGRKQLLVASGGLCYVLNLDTNVFTAIPPGTLTGVTHVGFSDGFFLALTPAVHRWQVSALLDATTWDASVFDAVSLIKDDLMTLFVDHREIWICGRTSAAVYYINPSVDFPFAVNTNVGLIQIGTPVVSPAVRLDSTIYWIGQDENGLGIGYKASGYNPQRITTFAEELAWQSYSTIADAVSYGYQENGHSYWVIIFPTAGVTWGYDVATGLWHKRGFWDTVNGVYTAHRSINHTVNFGLHLVGDWASGNIYQMSSTIYQDFGNPIRRLRRAPHISREQERIYHRRLQLDVETGLGPMIPLTGTGIATFLTLRDSSGGLWQIGVDDNGILSSTKVQTGSPATYNFVDLSSGATSWSLTVTTGGLLQTTSIAPGMWPQFVSMVSASGGFTFSLQVLASGALQTANKAAVGRDPQAMLRWSDDGGHTWGNVHTQNCGQMGQFKKRVIWRRLGASRDRVYEVTVSDPIPWRIIDAYLQTDRDGAVDRLSHEIRKRA